MRVASTFCTLFDLGIVSSAQSPIDSEEQLLHIRGLVSAGIESSDEQPVSNIGSIVNAVM